MSQLVRAPERWREWLLFHLPSTVTTYPYETFLCFCTLFSGVPLAVLGVGQPGSVEALLPGWMARAWGVTLLLAGLTLAYGLLRMSMAIAVGMSLLANVCTIYIIAILKQTGSHGIVPASFVAVVALLCAFRGFYLRAAHSVHVRISRVAEEMTPSADCARR